ncbi:MAG: 16S rRNA (guanine(966)-N(2))-methyltransferase RsmD [Spirochaetaceae bacterium]|nr:MAG: 16S rRNA (guanine(966)-N(2))-methyltransferase RsmD [Spirochaetaceae bacterium]
MRVIGGRYRGRTITCPPGVIRPAMDKMKESIFSSLGDLDGFSFLDLFSGSGSIGIEAASRGASPVVLVERDRGKLTTLNANTAFVETEIRVVCAPAERFLLRASHSFSLIFLDPPFDYPYKTDILTKTTRSRAVGPTSTVLIHLPTRESLPDRIGMLRQTDRRIYGGSAVVWFGPDGDR